MGFDMVVRCCEVDSERVAELKSCIVAELQSVDVVCWDVVEGARSVFLPFDFGGRPYDGWQARRQ